MSGIAAPPAGLDNRREERRKMIPITIIYDFLFNEPYGCERKAYTAKTYEDYNRIVRILHENPEKYKVVSVTKEKKK